LLFHGAGNGFREDRAVSTRHRTRRAGFTLVEVILAIVLIGLIVRFGLPKLNWSGYRINSAVRGVTAVLARAERMAITNQSNVNVLFDVPNNAIKIHEDLNNDNVQQPTERVRAYPLGEGIVFGLGGAPPRLYTAVPISFTRTQNGMLEIIFRRDGSASENGGFYITTTTALNSSRPQDARSIELTQATGRASWYQYLNSTWVKKF
jgi:prepilin-type N-terminal cleavage/methylation domain-containing protein